MGTTTRSPLQAGHSIDHSSDGWTEAAANKGQMNTFGTLECFVLSTSSDPSSCGQDHAKQCLHLAKKKKNVNIGLQLEGAVHLVAAFLLFFSSVLPDEQAGPALHMAANASVCHEVPTPRTASRFQASSLVWGKLLIKQQCKASMMAFPVHHCVWWLVGI